MKSPLPSSRRSWLASAALAALPAGGVAGSPTVDVWVELTQAPTAAAGADAAARQRQAALVTRQQALVATQLQQLGATELARVRHTRNAIAVRIDPARLGEVRALAGVRDVRPVVKLHPPRTMAGSSRTSTNPR